MQGPYGLEMGKACQTCRLSRGDFFCRMPAQAMKDFQSIRTDSAYPSGAILFIEKQAPRGVFVLCEGEIKLSITSSRGKSLILRIVKPGEIMGLMAVFSNRPYEVTAETLRPSRVCFIRRQEFVRFLAQYPETYQNVAQQLSANYHTACEQLRTVGLSATAPVKLARLLLEWSSRAEPSESKEGVPVKLRLTHEEMAECIGSTRETVTRTLSEFKNRRLLAMNGCTLIIPSRTALESYASAG